MNEKWLSKIENQESYVCADCFDDPSLKDFVEGGAVSTLCSFCGNESEEDISAEVSEVVSFIEECLRKDYDDPANWLSYESREGGYQGSTWDTGDLLLTVGLELPNDDGRLFDTIVGGIDNWLWCERDPYGASQQEVLEWSWEHFCEIVKHKRRFFFLDHPHDPDDREIMSTKHTLDEIGNWCERFELVKSYKQGTQVYRARFQKEGEALKTVYELGPPPEEKALLTNRMSPPGVVMFYVSDNPDTAIRETANDEGKFAIAKFELRRDLQILDLVNIPPVPSIFETISETSEFDPAPPLIFLNRFARDVSKPIERDDRIHIEYIPTQVITEFFRHRFTFEEKAIDGIRFRSSRHPGQVSYVLFATQEDLILDESQEDIYPYRPREPWIALVGKDKKTVTKGSIKAWNDEPIIHSFWSHWKTDVD